MPYADPNEARKYNRDYQRRKRQEQKDIQPEKSTTNRPTMAADDIKTAKGLLKLLTEMIAEVYESDVEILSKARVIGYLVGVGIKTVELTTIEDRLQQLEKGRSGGANFSPGDIYKIIGKEENLVKEEA